MDIYERSKAAIGRARAQALVSVREKNFPASMEVDPETFGVLGKEWSRRGANLHAGVIGDVPMVAGPMLAVTMRLRWLAVYEGAYYCELMGSHPSVYAPIPHGYADHGVGWAFTLSELLSESQDHAEVIQLCKDCGIKRPETETIHKCDALLWIGQAAEDAKNGNWPTAMNNLAEAAAALEIGHGLFMWDGGYAHAQSETGTHIASKGGMARAKKFAPAKTYVIREWSDKGNAYGFSRASFSRAYSRLVKQKFGHDVTERTIASVWLKNIPDTSKP